MSELLKASAIGAVTFMALDGLWLGLLMNNFYRTQLAPIARMSEGRIAPVWSVALWVYVLLGLGIGEFVLPRATTWSSAAGLGAVLGLVIYGVYDLTNQSTLAQWPAAVTCIDMAWGMIAGATASAVTFAVLHR